MILIHPLILVISEPESLKQNQSNVLHSPHRDTTTEPRTRHRSNSSMAANSFTHSPLRTPSLYSLPPVSILYYPYPTECPPFCFRSKSTCYPLVLSSRCRCAALTINGTHSATLVTDSGIMLFQLFQEMGLNEKDTEAILNMNAELRSMPYAHIRTRIQLLRSVGLDGFALSRIVVKRPAVLTAPEVDALLSVIIYDGELDLNGKIETAQIERLLSGTDPRLLVGFGLKVRLLLQFGIPQESLVKVLNTVNLIKALCSKSLEEMERMLAFLNPFGGVDLILRRPAILNYHMETQLMPRIGYLFELSGRNEHATATVLRKFPFALAYSVDHVKDHVEFLKSYAGLTYEEVFKIILVYPGLFSASRRRKLHPRITFLKQCGLDSHDIYRFLIKAPLFLSLSFEDNLAHKLVFLVKIGYGSKTKDLAMAMGAVTRCSCKNFQAVIGVFLNYGLTCEDILDMSKKHPQVLQYNHGSLNEKLQYLTEEMGREVRELLSFPAYLGYKFDARIKHRYEERRKVLGEGLSINKLLSVSTASFATKSRKKPRGKAMCDTDEDEQAE